jgi:four helix bundle protein
MQSFMNLKVWEKAHRLTLDVYQVTSPFPREELFGLTGQMRRASVSIGANIAEGSCRKGDPEFGRFLYMAMGSASELEYELLVAKDLGFVEGRKHTELLGEISEVKRMLASLIKTVGSSRARLKADS